MSYESVRAAVFSYISTQWAAVQSQVPLEFENLILIDHATRSDPFVTLALQYRDATQASIESVPTTRFDGEALFHIHVPPGRGTKVGLTLADSLVGFMKYAKVSNVQFQAPRMLSPQVYLNWYIIPLSFSFFYRE